MGANTGIEWCDATFNPWWGCTKVSDGCKFCYADTLSKRYGHDIWGPKAERRFFGEKHWAEPLKWNRDAERDGRRKRVFCASMADVFEKHMLPEVNDAIERARARLFTLIHTTRHLDWLLLTKRPENILSMIPVPWRDEPPHNVWYGTSVESQEYAEQRIPELLKVPAVVRFLSAEPLLGPIDLSPWLGVCEACEEAVSASDPRWRIGPNGWEHKCQHPQAGYFPLIEPVYPIGWVIAGGESGPGARPMHPDWARQLRDQCQAASVAYFFKQWGEWLPYDHCAEGDMHFSVPRVKLDEDRVAHRVGKKAAGRLLDGRTWDQFPAVEVPA